jgi:hypothetical protein
VPEQYSQGMMEKNATKTVMSDKLLFLDLRYFPFYTDLPVGTTNQLRIFDCNNPKA